MVIKWIERYGDLVLNARGRKVADAIEFALTLIFIVACIGIAGGIETGSIPLPWEG
jgi:hypothetical protein